MYRYVTDILKNIKMQENKYGGKKMTNQTTTAVLF